MKRYCIVYDTIDEAIDDYSLVEGSFILVIGNNTSGIHAYKVRKPEQCDLTKEGMFIKMNNGNFLEFIKSDVDVEVKNTATKLEDFVESKVKEVLSDMDNIKEIILNIVNDHIADISEDIPYIIGKDEE